MEVVPMSAPTRSPGELWRAFARDFLTEQTVKATEAEKATH
jgi:hypothetical protein